MGALWDASWALRTVHNLDGTMGMKAAHLMEYMMDNLQGFLRDTQMGLHLDNRMECKLVKKKDLMRDNSRVDC